MYGSENVNKNMQLSLKAGLCVMMEWQGNIVLENGQLNDKVILKREPLYTGTNGKVIERFFITPTESFIFKPLTNDEQIGKEVSV